MTEPRPTRDDAWLLAQLRPNQVEIATRNLERQGFEVFCPRKPETRRARNTFRTELRPLFPGYLFVRPQPGGQPWHAIGGTRGVSRLVALNGGPARVPHALVAELRNRWDHPGRTAPPLDNGPPLDKGDRVRVTLGPFTDFIATVEGLAPDRRVWVLIEMLGSPTRAALPRLALLPA